MDPFFAVREMLSRAVRRRWLPLSLAAGFLVFTVLGAVFCCTSAGYGYALRMCERYLTRVCFSDRSVIVIFFERTAGHALLAALVLLGGLHAAALPLPVVVMLFRACTLGGNLAVFFTVYRMTGALVVFALYLPVHLCIDGLLLLGTALSFSRARQFRFCRTAMRSLVGDVILLCILIAAVCLAEAILLLALFHPIGHIA